MAIEDYYLMTGLYIPNHGILFRTVVTILCPLGLQFAERTNKNAL